MSGVRPEKIKIFPCIWQAIILLCVSFALMVGLGIASSIFIWILKMCRFPLSSSLESYIQFSANLILIPIALGVMYITKQPLKKIFSFANTKLIYFLPLIVLVIGSSILESEMDNFTRYIIPMPAFIQKIMMGMVQEQIPSFILLVLIASFTEELLFRGVILRAFLTHYGKLKSIFVSALFFALFHVNIYQFFSAFVLGLILGWIYTETRSLYLCFFVHSFHNFLCWLCAFNILNIYIPGYAFDGEIDYEVVKFQPWWFNLSGILLMAIGAWLLQIVFRMTASRIDFLTSEDNKQIEEGSIQDQAVDNI